MIQYRRLARLLMCLSIAFVFKAAADPAPETVLPGQVLRGHFVQMRQLTGFAKPLRSEGSFVLAPGRGLIWRGEKPFPATTIITADGILQLANGQEAMRLSSSKLPGLAQLYSVLGAALSGNTNPLRQSFAVSQSSDANGWRVELNPLNTQSMTQLKGLILKGGRYVVSVDVERNGGDADHITFSEQKVTKGDLTSDEIKQLKATGK